MKSTYAFYFKKFFKASVQSKLFNFVFFFDFFFFLSLYWKLPLQKWIKGIRKISRFGHPPFFNFESGKKKTQKFIHVFTPVQVHVQVQVHESIIKPLFIRTCHMTINAPVASHASYDNTTVDMYYGHAWCTESENTNKRRDSVPLFYYYPLSG